MANREDVLNKLTQIEEEMRRIKFWDDSLDCDTIRKDAMEIVTEQRRSPVGLMLFEHWLQAVFIPNAREAARSGHLPSSSQVGVMAMREYDYHSHVTEAEDLLHLLYEFDRLF